MKAKILRALDKLRAATPAAGKELAWPNIAPYA